LPEKTKTAHKIKKNIKTWFYEKIKIKTKNVFACMLTTTMDILLVVQPTVSKALSV